MTAIRLVHGTSDRATSHLATLRLYERLPNDDKEIQLYEGYEHGESQKLLLFLELMIVMLKASHQSDGTDTRLDEMNKTTKKDSECLLISEAGLYIDASSHMHRGLNDVECATERRYENPETTRLDASQE